MDNKNNYEFIGMNRWESLPLDLDLEYFPSNLVYDYKNFNPLNMDDIIDNHEKKIQYMRKAAEIHRQVRRFAQEMIKPGVKLIDICNTVENRIIKLCGENNFNSGIGFPTGLSINHIAAHDSANPNDKRTLKYGDVCKVDFGTHVKGNIIDSAFTICFDPKFKPLLDASRDGTWAGIKLAGPDARINDISQVIQEAIESYEIDINGKTYPIKSVKNLGGHNILPYKIHAGKLILGGPHESIPDSMKMQANECYAIETFATTGHDHLLHDTSMECNHFMRVYDISNIDRNFRFKVSNKVYNYVNRNRGTLPFANRWVNDNVGKSYNIGISKLEKNGVIESYPPLVAKKGMYTSQWEHTIYLHEYGKEIMSKGDDY